MREHGGWSEFEMVPLEELKCASKLQARIKEQEWIDKIEHKLNVIRAYSDEKTKMRSRQDYLLQHRDEIALQRRQYY